MQNKKPKKPARQALIVLGVHRSGTSALCGVLAKLGVQPPKTLMKPASDNPRGFWESKEIVAFHERLLASIGSVWSDWSEIDKGMLESKDAIEQIALLPDLIDQEFGDARLFFVKDPRMCRFSGVWLRALAQKGIEAKAVIPIRHPAEVANSLASRNHLGMVRSRLIWLRHVLDAEHATRTSRRTFVPYARLLASWRTEVKRMGVDLALDWPVPLADAEPRIKDFLHTGLRHFSEEVEVDAANQLDDWVNNAYAILQGLARKEEPGAMQRLDDIRHEFNLAASTFAPALRETELAHAEAIAGLRKQLDAKPAASISSTADIAALIERKLTEIEPRVKAEQRVEISKFAESIKAEQVAHQAEIARIVKSMRMDAQRHDAVLVALTEELRFRKQLADDLESKVSEQSDELTTLRRRLEQADALYRQESVRRKAINAELEGIVAEQSATLDSSADKIRAAKGEIADLRQKFDRLKSSHASAEAALLEELDRQRSIHARDTAALRDEILRQQHITEGMREDLYLVHSSRGWRILNLFRRVLGRQPGILQDELAATTELIENSDLFDRRWYLDKYPDVARSGMDPVEHYLRFGAAELRNPSLEFDTRSYLDRYSDVRDASLNPLLHYIQFGMREGRDCGVGKSE